MNTFHIAPIALVLAAVARADDFDRPPIDYETATPHNVVTQLQQRIDAGQVKVPFVDEFGYLPAVLKELNLPRSSQMLVFSKTSLQRDRISPRTPRALYFNDDVYVGFCRLGNVMEVSVADPELGAVFYTLRQEPADKPRFQRQTDHCLICHTSRQQGIPAHTVRSIYPDRDGNPILSSGSFRIDHSSPLKDRWGGWYVTGAHGSQTHLGNFILPNRNSSPDGLRNDAGLNVTDLKGRVDTGMYLTPHSDIVALMVLEHQTEMHNRITAANFQTKVAHRDADVINELDNAPKGRLTEGTSRRIDGVADQLVKYMLFSEEARLTEPVKGTSAFADEFAKRGPFDKKGRSLRQFDLSTRIFKYPCSYLIYSAAFDGLPASVKERIYQRLWDVLTGKDTSKEFAHLSAADRLAIKEILIDTKPGLPSYWK
ncbi:MAG TPA: hypothetical protein VHR66_13260 [Gemmataceae bacterium]|jgi:hypothetical protein|nr:hypothetical protein [Gemmataceae bacterium]